MKNAPPAGDILALLAHAAGAIQALREGARAHAGERFPVTEADRAGSAFLERELAGYGFPVVSEENDAPVPPAGFAWLIDPLDGTSNFVRGQGDWCIMAALLSGARPVMSVVYAPERGEAWHACRGQGAYRSRAGRQERLAVSNVAQPREARMLMSRTHPSERMEAARASLGARALVVGSIGIKLGLIAAGEAESYWNDAPLGTWDAIPGLIVEEAGGAVSDVHGAPLAYASPGRRLERGIAASNGALHEALLAAGRVA